MTENVVVKGRIQRFRTRFDSGWCVFTLTGGETCKGVIPGSIQEGDQVEVCGHWNETRYGRQIEVQSIIADRPASTDEIQRYLVAKIKHIDENRARLIVQRFGADTFRIFDEEPARLLVIPGISEGRLEEIMAAWKAGEQRREADRYFARLGIPVGLADRIIAKLGPDQAKAQVEEDPYKLGRLVSGMSFTKCDEIGRAAGIEADDPRRLKAGIVSILDSATNNGDCFLYRKEHEKIFRWADRWAIHPAVHTGGYESADLVDLLDEEAVVITEDTDSRGGESYDRLYLRDLYLAEWTTARALLRLLNEKSTEFSLDMSSERFQQLTDGQRAAVETALKNNVMVLTGPPGTGKTFVARFLIDTLQEQLGGTVALAAPTGRAAKRMEELTGRPSSTIHRLLNYGPAPDPVTGAIVMRFRTEYVESDLLVIDETSMLDIRLAHELFKRVVPGTRVILIGDPDQLPSVGPGNVLADLLTSKVVPVARLTEIMRQKAENPLVLAAHAIRKGESVDWDFGVRTDGGDTLLHHWIQGAQRNDEQDARTILAETKKVMRWARSVGFDPMEHVQVLCPQKKGPLGTPIFNEMLQETLNADGFAAGILEYGKRRFVVGDRVIQTRNNYEARLAGGPDDEQEPSEPETDDAEKVTKTAVFNGDIGRIECVERGKNGKSLLVRFADLRLVRYAGTELEDLELAYAITIHKSQGSEFPVVVMPVHSCNNRMLRRNLFYTAVTRAQKICVLIGQERMAVEAIRNNRVDVRNTTLAELLREEYPYRYGNATMPADEHILANKIKTPGPAPEPSPEEGEFVTGETILVQSGETDASGEDRLEGEDLREVEGLAASGTEIS